MIITEQIAKLNATRAEALALELSIAEEMSEELATLPARYGFDSVAAFLKAVKSASRGSGKRGKVTRGKSRAKPAKRARGVITDETRTKIRAMVEAGKTGNEIAKATGISTASVQNVKKALGLVRKK